MEFNIKRMKIQAKEDVYQFNEKIKEKQIISVSDLENCMVKIASKGETFEYIGKKHWNFYSLDEETFIKLKKSHVKKYFKIIE